jgi:hypothetical protein
MWMMLAAAAPAEDERLADWRLERTIGLAATLHHVQGIDVEGDWLWVSSVDAKRRRGYVSLFRLGEGRLVKQVEVQDGERFHPGGMVVEGNWLWVPVAEYRRASTTTMQRRDKRTLALVGSCTVADHIGCVAAGADFLVGGNWDSRVLYTWGFDGRELGRRENPGKTSYQDMKLVDGVLLGAGNLTREQGAIEWRRWPTLELERRVVAGRTDRGVPYTHEGMTLRGGRLYLLPEDDPSRLFVFAAPEQAGGRASSSLEAVVAPEEGRQPWGQVLLVGILNEEVRAAAMKLDEHRRFPFAPGVGSERVSDDEKADGRIRHER